MFFDTLLNNNEREFCSIEQQKRRKNNGSYNSIILDLIKKIDTVEIIDVSYNIETKILLAICKLCNLIIQNKTKKIMMKKDSNIFYIFYDPW